MKIASYNIWNSDRGMPQRQQLIIDEINKVDADVICLQEVKENMFRLLDSKLDIYPYSYYHSFKNIDDELAVFSKYPIEFKMQFDCAIAVTVEIDGLHFLIINVHLPWDSMLNKEKYIIEIIKDTKDITADYAFLLGDFNCSAGSSVHQFIMGEQTLNGTEANPLWEDLALIDAEIKNIQPKQTLDIRNNPRWKGRHHAYTGSRMDRIYLRDAFPKPAPEFVDFWVFGEAIDQEVGYSASDHYGVAANINF